MVSAHWFCFASALWFSATVSAQNPLAGAFPSLPITLNRGVRTRSARRRSTSGKTRRHSDGAQDVPGSGGNLQRRPARFCRDPEQNRHRLPPDDANWTSPSDTTSGPIKLDPELRRSHQQSGHRLLLEEELPPLDQVLPQGTEAVAEFGVDLQQPGHRVFRAQELQEGVPKPTRRRWRSIRTCSSIATPGASCCRSAAWRSAPSFITTWPRLTPRPG